MVISAPPTQGAPRTQAMPNRNDEVLRWSLPSKGWTKLNIDDSFMAPTGQAGCGMVSRDHAGSIIFSACQERHPCDSPLDAELEACREGLKLAHMEFNSLLLLKLIARWRSR